MLTGADRLPRSPGSVGVGVVAIAWPDSANKADNTRTIRFDKIVNLEFKAFTS